MSKSTNRKILGVVCSGINASLNFLISRVLMQHEVSKIMKRAHIPNKKVAGEDEWYKKWKTLGVYVNRKYYRTFSRFIDPVKNDLRNICPDDICHNLIEPLLNPIRYRSYYSDKNEFDKILGQKAFPKTILRNMNGQYLDAEYHAIDPNHIDLTALTSSDGVIVKPSIDSSSGKGVQFFKRMNGGG